MAWNWLSSSFWRSGQSDGSTTAFVFITAEEVHPLALMFINYTMDSFANTENPLESNVPTVIARGFRPGDIDHYPVNA